MKSSEILREAAKAIEDGKWDLGRHAISYACRPTRAGTMDFLRAYKWFSDALQENKNIDAYWWPREARNGPRIIGLCLAAAIAESEGD